MLKNPKCLNKLFQTSGLTKNISKMFSKEKEENQKLKNISEHRGKENVFTYLNERGLISNISHKELINNEANVNSFLKDNPRLYIGFDPTAESLHLGNLIGIITALRFSAFGVDPVFLIGGATGQIGDPSGKSKERPLLNKEKVENNYKMIESNLSTCVEEIKRSADFSQFTNEKKKNFTISNLTQSSKENKRKENSSSSSDEEEKSLETKLKRIAERQTNLNFNKFKDSLDNDIDLRFKKFNDEHSNILKEFEDSQKEVTLMKSKELRHLHKLESEALFNNHKIVNNLDFYKDLNIIDFLREAGTNLRMGPLLSRETVKNRINTKEGLSLTEFMYQAFQGYDFLKLYEKYNVKIQIGGSDQWGNMLAGYELVKKMKNVEVLNLTFPLMTTATGQKFGKSEGNALFINPKLTPINNIYQYFYNLSDADLHKMFCAFTFLEKEEIDHIVDFHNKKPELRNGQKLIAEKITSMLFTEEEARKCVNNQEAHYINLGNMDLNNSENFDNIFKNCQTTELSEDCLENMSISKLCVEHKIFPTKAQCKRLIQSGSLHLNDNKVEDDVLLNKEMLLGGKYLVVKAGKKNTHIFELKLKEEALRYI